MGIRYYGVFGNISADHHASDTVGAVLKTFSHTLIGVLYELSKPHSKSLAASVAKK